MTGRMAESSAATEVEQISFDVADPQHVRWAVGLWNDATGNELPITERFLKFNFTEDAGVARGGRIAFVEGRPAGFVLCSACPGAPSALSAGVVGWIEAIAVASSYQRQGIGKALLRWVEEWLASQSSGQDDSSTSASDDGAETERSANLKSGGRIQVGGGIRPFAPGPLADSAAEAFFLACGYDYAEEPFGWDVARSLSDYQSPPLREAPAAARPGQQGQEAELLSFLAKEFPGRWHWQAERFLEEGGRISDYMLLWTQEGVQGSCRLTFEDSVNPIDRFYPYGLPRPWAQLGSIGVSAHLRGLGMGLLLLDAGLRRLHNSGINGCVIDWTTLLDFYAKCGFRPYRKWAQLGRTLGGMKAGKDQEYGVLPAGND